MSDDSEHPVRDYLPDDPNAFHQWWIFFGQGLTVFQQVLRAQSGGLAGAEAHARFAKERSKQRFVQAMQTLDESVHEKNYRGPQDEVYKR
jgi:hypothetical protein